MKVVIWLLQYLQDDDSYLKFHFILIFEIVMFQE